MNTSTYKGIMSILLVANAGWTVGMLINGNYAAVPIGVVGALYCGYQLSKV